MHSDGYNPYFFEKPEHEKRLEAYRSKPIPKHTILGKWKKLLQDAKEESEAQKFLERHPFFLPGLYDYHHGPLWSVVVSQLPLAADYVADFAFATANSGMLQFTFVEIERPHKRIFNNNGQFSQGFNESLQQIIDWKVWCDKNGEALQNLYANLLEGLKFHFINSKFYFVCGRRNETEKTLTTKERWSGRQSSIDRDISIMTYDRLTDTVDALPVEDVYNRYVVCTYKKRAFVVKPSTLR